MNKMLTYYLLPLQTSFRYMDVIDALDEHLNQLSKPQSISIDLHLIDNYIGSGPIPIDLESPFAWRSPEIESLVITFKQRGLAHQSLTINCDFSHYNFLIEEIAEDSGILNEDQLSIIQKDGYWYWSFSTIENQIEQAYIDLFIKSLLNLSEGIVFSCKNTWDLVMHPTFRIGAKKTLLRKRNNQGF